MTVELLQPNRAPASAPSSERSGGFAAALDAIGGVLDGAQRAEDAFANGSGTLQAAVYARARADVGLSVAIAAAQRAAQALQTVLNLSV